MNSRIAPRGQPLVVLAVLLGAWIVARTALWQMPFADPSQGTMLVSQDAPGDAVFAAFDLAVEPRADPARPPARAVERAGLASAPEPFERIEYAAPPPEPMLAPVDPAPILLPPDPPPLLQPLAPRSAAGHSLMLMAGFSNLELPPEIARYLAPHAAPAAIPFQPAIAGLDRWSADLWLLLRDDSTNAVTSGRGSYGRSQLGAVLRYRLWPASPHRPTAYLRVGKALAGGRESEAALGLAGRPVPGIPLVLAAELRFVDAGGQMRTRPAAYAVTELPPARLPGGFTGEAYFQGGYVGGDFATAFVDGQVRAERKLFDLGPAELRVGGGLWGGAQEGASRLDIGPGATLKLTIGQTPARASMGWRFRIAGSAEPNSGPALTISAGF